ncbi:hypothetical protein KXS07_37325, partial [Inquilinus limosus]|uniref:hypothetical protein n=1 Tax=Inquilinus limosus TaxID=171674 RepID=UPI003F14EEE4
QYGDASSAPKDTTADNGDQTDAQDETEEPSIWDSLWSRHFSGTIANTMTSFTGTNVDYSTKLSYRINTGLDLSVSTAATYRSFSGNEITHYSSGYSQHILCGDGSISLGTEGGFSTIGQMFFTPGTIVLGSRPRIGSGITATNEALLTKVQLAARIASYAAVLADLVNQIGTKFIRGFPQSAFNLPSAILARIAAPAATTAAALLAKFMVGDYKLATRGNISGEGRLVQNPDNDPTIKIEPNAITLSVGPSNIRISSVGILFEAGASAISLTNEVVDIWTRNERGYITSFRLNSNRSLTVETEHIYMNGNAEIRGDCEITGQVTTSKMNVIPRYGHRMDANQGSGAPGVNRG